MTNTTLGCLLLAFLHTRYDGIWQEGVVKCGSYSEVQPAPPGAPGALPCIELCSPAGVLQEGAAAALGLAS